ncbi:hypothetical protein DFP74_1788 [Nocardiopsis sp. Huas11]|uniref:hypothetical protein n=1 Tax=Nocardiopsis sp. Huas11 TaxID=2183912 RepID=UPI000EB0EF32|nr:hypothetical protein [Nocardiopsis sp. Huas11]RKS06164.1 hypothetical protein DFP74_1788 [Nocardiopsis sp. Huas11]
MFISNTPFIIGAALLCLVGVGGVACSFAAPVGRKGLAGTGSALVLAGAAVFLALALWSGAFNEALAPLFGGRTAWLVLNTVDYVFTAGLGTGLILLALAATRRPSRPAPHFTPHQPYGPHAPGTPYQHGPAQG